MSTTKNTLKTFWSYTRRYQKMFWVGNIGAILAVIAQDIVPPFIISRSFSKLQTVYALHQPIHFGAFKVFAIIYIISVICGIVLWRLQTYAVWEFEIRAQKDMIIDIFNHIQRQGQKFHANHFGGGIVSQANKFISGYEKFMDEFIWSILSGITAILFSLIVMTFVSWKFALIMIGVISFYTLVVGRLTTKSLNINKQAAESDSHRTAALADTVTNVATVRAFGHEKYELTRFSNVADQSYKAYHKLSTADFINSTVSHTITSSFRITAFLFGIFAVTNLHANAGLLYLLISYTTGIVDRLWQFSRVTRNINRALGDANEMTAILALKPEVADPKQPEQVRIHDGEIQFTDVQFSHDGSEQQSHLFNKLNLHIKSGEKVGLVGPSGGGKTTLTGVLLRFMDISDGAVTIDGQNIAAITQEDLRKNIAYVPQEPILFHRTLAENIQYGNLAASKEEIQRVTKLAHADGFIQQLPAAYDTYVGERGVKLSGGQRQRIAIARAMLKDAPILILDEATSALDSESEVLIQDALWKLMEGRTAIVIAHRLSTIQKMDRILVLDNGEIAEQGTHKELIKANGIYAKLWNHQSGGFMED